MLVPFAVAKSGYTGRLGVSWTVGQGCVIYEEKESHAFSFAYVTLWKFPLDLITLPVLAFGSFSSPLGFVQQQQYVWAFGHSRGTGNA